MRSLKRILFVAGSVGVAVALIFVLRVPRNPFWKAEPELKAWILSQAPLGSSPRDVVKMIAAHGWEKNYEWTGTPSHFSETFYPAVKGSHVIGAYLGHYHGLPWRVDIDAFWGFDADGKLLDLNVRKMADAL